MKIVFDARMFGHSFGIGVYTRELISRLPIQGRDHQFTFLVRPADETYIREHIVKGAKNVRLVPTKISHYSWAEQLVLPLLLMRLNAQVVHFPNLASRKFCNFIRTCRPGRFTPWPRAWGRNSTARNCPERFIPCARSTALSSLTFCLSECGR